MSDSVSINDITKYLRQGMAQSDDDNNASPAIIAALPKLKRSGIEPENIVVLDLTNANTTKRSMLNKIKHQTDVIVEGANKIRELEQRNATLEKVIIGIREICSKEKTQLYRRKRG